MALERGSKILLSKSRKSFSILTENFSNSATIQTHRDTGFKALSPRSCSYTLLRIKGLKVFRGLFCAKRRSDDSARESI